MATITHCVCFGAFMAPNYDGIHCCLHLCCIGLQSTTQHGHQLFSKVLLAIVCYHSLERTSLPQNLISCFCCVNTFESAGLGQQVGVTLLVFESMACSVSEIENATSLTHWRFIVMLQCVIQR
jgi:hypothetical protein